MFPELVTLEHDGGAAGSKMVLDRNKSRHVATCNAVLISTQPASATASVDVKQLTR